MTGDYVELAFTIVAGEDYIADILVASLADIEFDTFESNETGFKAYIAFDKFNPVRVEEILSSYKNEFVFNYETHVIPSKNWNEIWEANFAPVIIANQIYIRAEFHPAQPQYEHQLIIQPKMAFGTGHHETTFQMAEKMLELDFKAKNILDMGCGTGILAMLASKMGANAITAIDNDPIAVESCNENFQLNAIFNATAFYGDASFIQNQRFDILLANINRNILLKDMGVYANALIHNGILLLSGFYEDDLGMIRESAEANALQYVDHCSKNKWVVAQFKK